MRTVAFLGLLSEIDLDAGLSRKAQVVGGICFSKALFWDSKYHVREDDVFPVSIALDISYGAQSREFTASLRRMASGVRDHPEATCLPRGRGAAGSCV